MKIALEIIQQVKKALTTQGRKDIVRRLDLIETSGLPTESDETFLKQEIFKIPYSIENAAIVATMALCSNNLQALINWFSAVMVKPVYDSPKTPLQEKINQIDRSGYAKNEAASQVNCLLSYIGSTDEAIAVPDFITLGPQGHHLAGVLKSIAHYVNSTPIKQDLSLEELLNLVGQYVGYSAQSAITTALKFREEMLCPH